MARAAQTTDPSTNDTPKVPKVTAREAFEALPTEGLDGKGEFIQEGISSAADLIDAKAEILSDLQEQRDFLNHAVKQGSATTDQAAWVTKYLPKRKRGQSDDESAESESE